MGESKLKLAKREEMLMLCAGVQTMAGRVQVVLNQIGLINF